MGQKQQAAWKKFGNPVFGPASNLAVVHEIILGGVVDVARFATAEKLVSYAGISPSHKNSGETRIGGGITKLGSPWLRNAMVDTTTVTPRFDPRMKAIYERVAKRRGKQKAKVAVARHMLEIIWHMLTAMREYRTKNDEMTQRKYKLMNVYQRQPDLASTAGNGPS